MNELEKTQKLIELKRYEQPPAGHLDGFVEEFHQRQRVELMRRSSRSLFCERLGTYLADFGKQRWLLAGGATCALLLALVKFGPAGDGTASGTAGVPEDFDAPQGQVTPVSTSSLLDPEFDLLEGLITPAKPDAVHAPLFFVDPVLRPVGESQIIEL